MADPVKRALMVARKIGSPARKAAFEQWGGSPERWYHGTSKDVDFSKFKVGRHGAWFTRRPEEASMYAMDNDSQTYKYTGGKFEKKNTHSRVIPVHLKFGKVHTGQLPDDVMGATNYKKAQSEWFDQLRAQGFNSWVPEGQNVAVILKDPTAIKSAIGNVGTFDPTNADIGKAEGGAAEHPLTQDVYHGTQHEFPAFREGLKVRAEYMPSLMLGTHVARDPAIASNSYFTQRHPDKGGHVMPLKTYPDEKFYPLEQNVGRGLMHDDDAVAKTVQMHAYEKHPDMLAFSLMQNHGADLHSAMEGAKNLVAGRSWTSPRSGRKYASLFDLIYSPHGDLRDPPTDFPSPEARILAVKSFRDHLLKQGYAGVKYINTADDETAGAKDKTCYIVFNKPTSEGYYPLRGRFAAMNPEDKADPDLMKAEGGMVEKADGGPIDAYHGSPHDFDKFDFSKIGTGEGAQVYGHGIYIAENPSVADSYRQVANAWATDEANGVSNAQSNYMYFRKAHKTPNKTTGRWVTRPAQSHEQAIKSVYDDLTETPEKAHIHRHTLAALDVFAKTGKWPMLRQGRLYDVRFHANPEHLVDLDKPTLGEQTPRVQRGIKDAIDMMPASVKEMSSFAPMRDKNTRPDAPIFGAMKFADEPRLALAGVPGNRYFDANSRTAKQGTRNYVVFPTEKDILEITRKRAAGGATKAERRALMIARDHQNLLRRVANIYPGPGGGLDPAPGGGAYAGPGGGKYIGPSRFSTGGKAYQTVPVVAGGTDQRGG